MPLWLWTVLHTWGCYRMWSEFRVSPKQYRADLEMPKKFAWQARRRNQRLRQQIEDEKAELSQWQEDNRNTLRRGP